MQRQAGARGCRVLGVPRGRWREAAQGPRTWRGRGGGVVGDSASCHGLGGQAGGSLACIGHGGVHGSCRPCSS